MRISLMTLFSLSVSVAVLTAPALAASDKGAAQASLVASANRARVEGDDVTAISLYKKALALDKGADHDKWTLCHMGESYMSHKQFNDALQAHTQAIAIWQKTANNGDDKALLGWMYYQRSKAQIALGHQAEAIADISVAIKYKPSDAGFYVIRSRAYVAIGRPKDAIDDLTKGLAISAFELNHPVKKVDVYRMRTARIEMLYERAKIYKSLSKLKEYATDKAEADKLTEEL